MVYNISYDLHEPSKKYEKLHNLIKEISNNRWAHILGSTYIIHSIKSADQIYKYLSQALDNNDLIIISEITTNTQGNLNKDHWKYIEKLF